MTSPDCAWLKTRPIAHRGLHDVQSECLENSRSAFAAAIDAGYGIELDLRITRDGDAAVFHDETLERMTSGSGPVLHRTREELRRLKLLNSGDTIPMLSDVLSLVNGRVPLLLEIKAPTRQIGKLEQRVVDVLRPYPGEVAVQSFNPLCIAWFRDNAPRICRGLLSTNYMRAVSASKSALSWADKFTLTHLLNAPLLRPHFIAYDVDALPALAPRLAKLLGLPLLAWTVSTERHLEIGAAYADNIIFENVRPPLGRND